MENPYQSPVEPPEPPKDPIIEKLDRIVSDSWHQGFACGIGYVLFVFAFSFVVGYFTKSICDWMGL